MEVTFYGAAREVTGSMHLLTAEKGCVLLDCGLFQGRRKETAHKNRTLPFDPRIVNSLVLSHAHIDHSGRIPVLVKEGFAGRIVCSRATAAASEYLLADSAHIQESDADYLNYKMVRSTLAEISKSPGAKRISNRRLKEIKKLLKKGPHGLNKKTINELISRHHLEAVEPLYTLEDVEQAIPHFDGYPYRYPTEVGNGITCTLYDAGHIMGSAIVIVTVKENGNCFRIGFTGDIGRFNKPIIRDPSLIFKEEDRRLDLLIMESTYGDREHEPVGALGPRLKQVLTDAFARGGAVLIPCFAFGRTQELIYLLHTLYKEGAVPEVPIYVDSPLAANLTRVFGEHPEVYDQETHASFLQEGRNPFSFEGIRFVSSVEESMAVNRRPGPHIVLAASGMCEGGRILHHFRHKIHDEKTTILIVGYMAEHTLGRRILEKGLDYAASGRVGDPPMVRFLNKEYPLRAHVAAIDGFSAHGDRNEMTHFVKDSNLDIQRIALVHGEEDQAVAFSEHLRGLGYPVTVPRRGEVLRVG